MTIQDCGQGEGQGQGKKQGAWQPLLWGRVSALLSGMVAAVVGVHLTLGEPWGRRVCQETLGRPIACGAVADIVILLGGAWGIVRLLARR